MISYFLAANCYGFFFFALYLLLLRNRSSHTWNRVYLLANVLLALVLPLVRFDAPGWYAPPVVQTLQAVSLPEVTLIAGSTDHAAWYTGWSPVLIMYVAVSTALLLRLAYRILRLRFFLRRQQRTRQDGYWLALNTGIGPASYGRTILFPNNEVAADILAHEKAHIAYKHHYDKLFLQLLQCLFFPVVPLFLIDRELGLVHEFEADADAGKNKEQYVRTLLGVHLGTPSLALLQPFFRHPLRRRIRMLQRNDRGNNRPAKGAALCGTVLALAVIVYAQSIQAIPVTATEAGINLSRLTGVAWLPQPAAPTASAVQPQPAAPSVAVHNQPAEVATPVQRIPAQTTVLPLDDGEHNTPEKQAGAGPVNDNTPEASPADERTFTAVEEMPKPPFDVMKYLSANIRYPKAAKEQNLEGRVVLQFVIDKDGSVNNIVLHRDIGGGCGEEAVRVVQNMPKWSPGRHAGQPVKVYYTLPVSFRLDDNTKPAAINH